MKKESIYQLSDNSAREIDNLDRSNLASIPSNGNPPISDLIAIKSTIPGFVSWRNSVNGNLLIILLIRGRYRNSFNWANNSFFFNSKGSHFIQALCKKLQEEYITKDDHENAHDLESILRGEGGVQSLVNLWLGEKRKQSIRWECSSLSKHIKFKKINELQELVSGPEDWAVFKAKF